MKKLFTILIGSLLVISVFAQQNKKHQSRTDNAHYKSVSEYVVQNLPDFWQPDYLFSNSHRANNKTSLSSNEVKQALDSIVVMGPTWTKDLSITEVRHYTYDSRGLCTEILILDYEPEIVEPLPRTYEVLTYDNQDRPKEYIIYYWDMTNSVWEENSKIEYVYSGGLISEFIRYTWNDDNQWELEMKDVMTYDANNDMVLYVVSTWNDGDYVNSFKAEISYYDNHYLKEEMNYVWVISTEEWMLTSKEVYTYDANWNVILEMQSTWVGDEWKDVNKTEMTYEGDQLVLSVQSSNYSYTDWTFDYKDEYNYIGNDGLLNIIEYKWEYESWQFFYKHEYSYTDAHMFDESLLPFDWIYGHDFTYQLTKVSESSWFSEGWTDNFQFLMYYSDKEVNAIHEMSLGGISVYPNPNNGVFTLKIDNEYKNTDVAVIDIFGRLLSTETISNTQTASIEKTFDLSAYGTGIYFLRITQADHEVYKKLVVQ